MKKKRNFKAKEPVRLRFKELSNGNKSLYLDIYKSGKRSYEFLKMYIVPNVDEASRTINANTIQAANAIKAQRIIEITNEEAGIKKDSSRSKMLLIDWMKNYSLIKKQEGQSRSFHVLIDESIRHLIIYKGKSVTIKQVDKNFCLGFIEYLKTAKKKTGQTIAASTANAYYGCFCYALNHAERMGIILKNPTKSLTKKEKLKVTESKRDYLDIDELKKLISAECRIDEVKRAFLFSCFCGLRISDIKGLKWGEIENKDGQTQVIKIMQKTQEKITLPLSKEAVRWIPKPLYKNDGDLVFSLPVLSTINCVLKSWAKDCGINKNVSFHVARHTFATMLLTLGADIYTVSKLLGHSNIKTTQIYAEIVDKKKDDAVNLTNSIFND